MNHRVLAVILGRAGSKGLPGKNSKVIAGQPMIAHAIADALESSSVHRVAVSTDGQAIADAARAAGAEVVMRPAELASDTATVDAAARHAVEALDDDADIIVILYANVPVRPDGLIDRAVARLIESGADSVQSYADVGKHHPYWMVTLDEQGRVLPHVPNTAYRRQDLPKLLLPDGGVIAVTRRSLFTVVQGQPHAFLGSDRRGIVVAEGAVVDVDAAIDAVVAEAILQAQQAEVAETLNPW